MVECIQELFSVFLFLGDFVMYLCVEFLNMLCRCMRVRCWSLPEIDTLSDEVCNLRCEVWIVLFSVTLRYVFCRPLVDCIEMGKCD